MKKINYFEIIGVLSLSFILTCGMAVSGSIPAMIEEFSNYSRSAVELLLSVPSFAMMMMIAMSPIIAKYIPERMVVAAGLLIYGITGILPIFIQSFPLLFVSRIIFGLGTGLVNAKAVTMIGERFTGELQQKLQGIRCSMETLGQTILTLIAGQILVFGWKYSFLVYGVAFIILIMFLLFVPKKTSAAKYTISDSETKSKLSAKDFPFIIGNALLGFLMVSTNVSLSLRISSYMLETGLGTSADGATIMGISTFAGFVAGIVFGFIAERLGKLLLPISLGIGVIGILTIIIGNSFILIAAGAALVGFCVTCCTSKIFGSLPERLPANTLTAANAVVLMGCNLGSFTAPFVLGIVDQINPDLRAGFFAYGIVYTVLIVFLFLKSIKKK